MSERLHTALPASEESVLGALLGPGAVRIVHQPIVRLRDDHPLGYEALARMATLPRQGPDEWLRLATRHGLRADLEVACLVAAVELGLPPGDGLLFLNLSPSMLGDERVADLLAPISGRVVLELSEQEQVEDYDSLAAHLADWQDRGARVAIDDTGSGYASLRHVLRLAPDFIKLDKSLVEGIATERSVRALVASFVAFAREMGAAVVAEGIETRAQLEVLRDAGVHLGQGYLLGRPGSGWRPTGARRALRLQYCATVAEVGEAVCEQLADRDVMPSFYLERDGLLRCIAQRGVWQVLDGLAPGAGITGIAYETGALVVVEDVATAEHYLEAIPGVVAEACAPVLVDGHPVGSLNIDSRRPLLRRDLDDLQRCAELAGKRLAALVEPAPDGPLARLVAATLRLERATTEAAIVDVCLEAAMAITGMSTAMLFQRAHPGRPPVAAVRGSLREALADIDPVELGVLLDVVVPSRSCYTAGDDEAVGMVGTELLRRAGVRSVVVVPIRPASATPALLAVASVRRRQLHTDTIEVLELLAAHAAGRLETLDHMAQLRRQALQDPLTGLGNRSAFGEMLDRWRLERTSGALCLLDIDDFKAVNDTFGHLEGDRVLVGVAAALHSAVRPVDGVFRLGGDEFAVLLPEVAMAEAVAVGDRLCLAASAVLAPLGAGASIGVAAVDPDRPGDDAMRAADRELYARKGVVTRSP